MLTVDIHKLARLPSLPTVAIEILKSLSNPEIAAYEIVSLISADPALSGKVLAAANSARYSTGRPIGDLHRAAMLLGKRVVCSLALGFSLAEASMSRGKHAALFKEVWLRSFAQGLAARTLAERYGECPADEAFTLGLISRIGQLVLLKHVPDDFAECIVEANRRECPVDVIEREMLGIDSQDLTLRILSQWKLPDYFLDAVRQQGEEPETHYGEGTPNLGVCLRIASKVADFIGSAQRGVNLVRLNESLSELSQRTDDEAEWLVVSVSKLLRQNSTLFQVDMSQIGTPTELLSDATEQLTRLAISGGAGSEANPASEQLLKENGELRQRIEELTRESTTDALTSVFNRRYFHRRLGEQITRAARGGSPVAVLLGDIDRFKGVNDNYGHPVGDRVLSAVAEAIESTVRGGDLVARYGGEEFVILVEAGNTEALRAVAERVRRAVADVSVRTEKGSLEVTISLGGCIGVPGGELAEFEARLLAEADRCLYEAKSAGRNRVVTAPISAAVPKPSAPGGSRSNFVRGN